MLYKYWTTPPKTFQKLPPLSISTMKSLQTTLTTLLLLHITISSATNIKTNKAQVKGMFVFGSSLVDNGNNNHLKNATTKANFHPYGIDFPYGPSGRFSNGRNAIDVLGELLQIPKLIPPFTDPATKGRRILHGVNFASGGSGILDQTGSLSGEVMSMNQQIKHFETATLPELRAQFGKGGKKRKFEDHICKYLFVVGTGGNDYLLNYFISNVKDKVSLPVFTEKLINELSMQLQKLHGLGARKFVLFSIQAMGCYPVVREKFQTLNGSCVEEINQAATLFNSHMKSLASNSRTQLPDSNMVFIDSYKIIRDIIDHPLPNGFSDTRKPCCEVNGILCKRYGVACSNRNVHVFFDGLHPTEAVNVKIAEKAYGSNLEEEAYPTNVKMLVMA